MGGSLDDEAGLGVLVLSEELIQARVVELGREIAADDADDPALLVCVL